jgi:exoribonuclease-2
LRGALDAVARTRMSTVYAPTETRCCPPLRCVLAERGAKPGAFAYVLVDRERLEIAASETIVERVRIEANLRHDRLDALITEETIAAGGFAAPFAAELRLLWRFARSLLSRREQVRGRPEPVGRIDYAFEVDGEGEHARVAVRSRRRGAPLDLIVAELMILANGHWGGWLASQRVAAIYRSQSLGRVKMGTAPAPHEGIGVDHYAWSSSPLRRYVDLVNQRQLLARIRGEAPPYANNDAELFAAVTASRPPTAPTPSSSRRWSATGRCAGSARKASND